MDPIWNTLQIENLNAFTNGQPNPHIILNHLWISIRLVWEEQG